MKTLLVLLAAVNLNVWLVNPKAATAPDALRRVLPEVHSVTPEGAFTVIRSAGFSTQYLGPLQNPPSPTNAVREFTFRIPNHPRPATGRHPSIGPIAGVFVNGMPIYNQWEAASYQGRNLWHYDLIAEAAKDPATQSQLLKNILADDTRHSPVLGYALDGYPIYGPYTANRRRMRSSYRLRNITTRESWPDGTRLTPGQYGPPVTPEYPLGTFVEDYEYATGTGDLDAYNGTFARTPEYPNGTYAYFLTATFPYLLAHRFQGDIATPPANLTFNVPHRHLEHVHEKPLHLIITSEDLSFFDHVHPEPNAQDQYAINYDFPTPGRYGLWADYTAPGQTQHIEASPIDIKSPGKPQPATTFTSNITLQPTTPPAANEETTFTIADTPANLQPYLGAWAHVVFIHESKRHFLHAHPEESATDPDASRVHIHGVTDKPTGPPPTTIQIKAIFPEPGRYKAWVQIQREGQVLTTPFTIQVQPARRQLRISKVTDVPPHAIRVTVNNTGFTPARIEAKPGIPLTLAITRDTTPNCGSRIVFPTLNLKRDLPLGATTLIALPPLTADLKFTCGMGMYRGLIVAR